jgi:hypothetical protein
MDNFDRCLSYFYSFNILFEFINLPHRYYSHYPFSDFQPHHLLLGLPLLFTHSNLPCILHTLKLHKIIFLVLSFLYLLFLLISTYPPGQFLIQIFALPSSQWLSQIHISFSSFFLELTNLFQCQFFLWW